MGCKFEKNGCTSRETFQPPESGFFSDCGIFFGTNKFMKWIDSESSFLLNQRRELSHLENLLVPKKYQPLGKNSAIRNLDFFTRSKLLDFYRMLNDIFIFSLQTFQRIQRNRQSRIRVKLSRRAAKRQDEILEEEDEIQQQKMKEHQQMRQKQTGKSLH